MTEPTANENRPRVPALGMFDGVHMGHRALIREAKRLAETLGAKPAVYTFSTHPAALFGRAPELITSFSERDALLTEAGAEEILCDPFDREMADLSPEAFIDMLIGRFHAVGLVAGFNYSFGKGASGTPEMLKELGMERGLTVSVMPEVTCGGGTVSSARIRALLAEEGNVALAGELLTRPYSLTGEVVHGLGNGHKLDFPTVNLSPAAYAGRVLPLAGVYATRAAVDGKTWPAVTNIGFNPTFGAEALTVETHLIGAADDFYGKTVTVTFMKRLRGETAFPSLDALRTQIARDIKAAKEIG